MPYLNGQIPYSVVSVVLASGTDSNGYWEFRCTPAFAARWAFAKKEAERRFGKTIYIRPGWNIYRPLFSQHIARVNACAQGNCNGAAVEGTSSHGGEWGGRPCLAVDVDPNGLTWDQVDQAMEAAGFSARLITAAMSGFPGGERWHYIDFNAFGAVPSGMDARPFEEDDMGTLDNTEANYQVFARFLQRALKWDVRRDGFGASANLGPSVFDMLGSADDSGDIRASSSIAVSMTEADRASIAAAVASAIKLPTAGASKAEVEKAVADGLASLVLKPAT